MQTKISFPKGFLWGTATAAHQVEGNNTKSDWWAWEKSKKNIEDSGMASDQYNRYKSDFKLAKNILHNNAHRFGIEWARIEPQDGFFDQKEIEHYKKVIKELKNLRIKRVVTMVHYTLPLWFYKKGAWEKRENIKYYERFVEKCAQEFGEDIDYWITLNEPNIYIGGSYLAGLWPPQKRSVFLAIKVYFNLIIAHKKAYTKIHTIIPNAKVSLANSVLSFRGINLIGKLLAKISAYVKNYFFLNRVKNYLDFVGINCYALHISELEDLLLRNIFKTTKIEKRAVGLEVDHLGNYIYPPGIYEITKDFYQRYKKPIMITENGIEDSEDLKRPQFIMDNLSWLLKSIQEGTKIIGYMHWSLIDNFEWAFGRGPRLGLFEVNYSNQARTPRKSAYVYGKICEANAISKVDFEKSIKSFKRL